MTSSTFGLRDDKDYLAFVKAKDAGDTTFTLRAQDATASLLVDTWIEMQLQTRSFMHVGLSLDEAVESTRGFYGIKRYNPGFDDPKLDGAATIARAMAAWTGPKKIAD